MSQSSSYEQHWTIYGGEELLQLSQFCYALSKCRIEKIETYDSGPLNFKIKTALLIFFIFLLWGDALKNGPGPDLCKTGTPFNL